jgi:hypothetical protein
MALDDKAGSRMFVFPVGVEGFRRSGETKLDTHFYIGDNSADGVVVHHEEAHIELSGVLPGLTAQDNMVDCISLLRSCPMDGMFLYVPGIFEKVQYVLPQTWDFSHEGDDRTHSISFTISYLRIGEGGKTRDPLGTAPPTNIPGSKSDPKGSAAKTFTVKAGARTLRQIASIVYGDPEKWITLYQLNSFGSGGSDTPMFTYATAVLPIGTVLRV